MTVPTYDLATETAYRHERIAAVFADRAALRSVAERRRRRPTRTAAITRRLRAV
jgi:hypothetical protein